MKRLCRSSRRWVWSLQTVSTDCERFWFRQINARRLAETSENAGAKQTLPASSLQGAGRCCRSMISSVTAVGKRRGSPERETAAEKFARVLLRRYGVVFRRLLERESFPATWYETWANLSPMGSTRRNSRRLFRWRNKRRTIRVAGGYRLLRSIRKSSSNGELITLSAADPLKFARYSHAGNTNRRVHRKPHSVSRWIAYCCARVTARFENSSDEPFLICKSKTRLESASCGRRCGRITNDRSCHPEQRRITHQLIERAG